MCKVVPRQTQSVLLLSIRCRPAHIVCTVTESTVIRFHGGVHSVQDRCTYSLMKLRGSVEFNMLAGFREKKRIMEVTATYENQVSV